jgi:hypothetical protein
MQLPMRFKRGQFRPWGSIPRIDWSHPLAQELVFYAYDMGNAGWRDLVSGQLASTTNTTPAKYTTNQYGLGTNFNSATAGDGVDQTFWWPNRTDIGAYVIAAGADFTIANAVNFLQVPSGSGGGSLNDYCSIFMITNGSGDEPFGFADWGGQFALMVDGNDSNPVSYSLNKFQSGVGVQRGAGTGIDVYSNGALVGTHGAVTSVATSCVPVINSDSSGAVFYVGGGVAGLCGYLFYGAFWKRPLTAGEVLQLHEDPYCFLIYPEDEIFAMLVGASAAAGYVPYNPWPQLGPMLAQ